MKEVAKAIIACAKEIDCVEKGRVNEGYRGGGSFNFRGIDDFYNCLHSIMTKHDLFSVPYVINRQEEKVQTRNGGTMSRVSIDVEYRFYSTKDDSYITAKVIGEAMDSGDKAYNKAMSIAHKYALIQVFSIPTEEQKDPDCESHEIVQPTQTQPKNKEKPVVNKKAAILKTDEEFLEMKRKIQTTESLNDLGEITKNIKPTEWSDKHLAVLRTEFALQKEAIQNAKKNPNGYLKDDTGDIPL